MTYQEIKNNQAINTYIQQADATLAALGYTEHSFAHVGLVAEKAGYILETLGYPARTVELCKIAGYMHDIGNLVNRVDHSQSGAVMAFRILDKLGVDLSGVDPNQWFTILSANEYGWVSQMQIGSNASGNDTCSGRWFREVLLARQSVDGRSLRSQCFTFTYDAGLDCFIFDVYGYGHGCGMSQWGAIGYARNGWDYKSILTHYYPGTTITTY